MKVKKVLAPVIMILLALAAMLTLSGCDKEVTTTDTSKHPVVKVGSDSYPPYNYLDEDGDPTGIDVELAKEAFGRIGYDVEIVQTTAQ